MCVCVCVRLFSVYKRWRVKHTLGPKPRMLHVLQVCWESQWLWINVDLWKIRCFFFQSETLFVWDIIKTATGYKHVFGSALKNILNKDLTEICSHNCSFFFFKPFTPSSDSFDKRTKNRLSYECARIMMDQAVHKDVTWPRHGCKILLRRQRV